MRQMHLDKPLAQLVEQQDNSADSENKDQDNSKCTRLLLT